MTDIEHRQLSDLANGMNTPPTVPVCSCPLQRGLLNWLSSHPPTPTVPVAKLRELWRDMRRKADEPTQAELDLWWKRGVRDCSDMLAALLPPEEGGGDTITDGFGSEWSAVCPTCKQKTMEVVRPGKVQCTNCEWR